MKKTMTAALALSLLAGTSAYAANADRNPDRQERRAEKTEARQERRAEKAEARQERREDRVAPAAVTVRQQRERVQERTERVQERREDVRERRDDLKERRQDLREARQNGQDVREQRLRLQQRQDRVQEQARDVRQQRDRVQQQRDRVQERAAAQRRAEAQRRADWLRQYRVGMYRLRDRDSGRSWYSYDRYRPYYQAQRRFHVSLYRYPSGWTNRIWAFGDIMPGSFYGQSYYLDWMRYNLPMPPIGAEWVRVRDDAVLVDTWSGRVLSVYYDLFW